MNVVKKKLLKKRLKKKTSRLQPLLLFTIQFPEISSTHFIDLGRMKG